MARKSSQARRKLDGQLERVRPLLDLARPHRGWIRAIRDALGMSSTELATRLKVTQQAVIDLEQSEQNDTIGLDTLRRAADALDCDLFYTLVPRQGLDAAVRAQALRKATRHLSGVAHHSRLEDQSLDEASTRAELEDLAASLVDRRGLWSDAPR